MRERFGRCTVGTLATMAVCVCVAAADVRAQAQTPAAQAQTGQPSGHEQTASQSPKFTLNGELALWTIAIRPDKTADFEKIMTRLHDALTTSTDPARQQQAAGWKVMKLDKPLPDGNIAYVHVIKPVPGADYTVMQILYDAYPNERQQLYDMYRAAFAQNLSLAAGTVVVDMSKPMQTAAANAAH